MWSTVKKITQDDVIEMDEVGGISDRVAGLVLLGKEYSRWDLNDEESTTIRYEEGNSTPMEETMTGNAQSQQRTWCVPERKKSQSGWSRKSKK